MPKYKTGKLYELKGKVISIDSHNPNFKNNGAYLNIEIYWSRELKKIKIVGTKEFQLLKFLNKIISIQEVYVVKNEYGIFYSCYNIDDIQKISIADCV